MTNTHQERTEEVTDREKNIAIAEWCGMADRWVICKHGLYYRPLAHGYTNKLSEAWMLTEQEADRHVYPNGDEPVTKERVDPPDYCNDLNEIHEAEKRLTLHQLTDYADEMDRVCVPVHICPLTHWQSVTMSTAAQRAEALLKTIGKWKE